MTTDCVSPAISGGVSNGFLHPLGQFLPSWWLVQASHVALHGQGWSARGWITVAAWSALLPAGAAWAYRRDTKRV
ncbi:MAG: hypothetical protein ACRDNK_16835 [Solirubrobacteraceae bacterium]